MRTEQRKRKQILIIDDRAEIVKYFERRLSFHFPDVLIESAQNGAAGIESFSLHHHDLLIIDLHMPVMSGDRAHYEINMICESREWEPPATIFVTGYEPPEEIRAMVAGNPLYALLLKPIHPDTLVKTVKKLLYSEQEADA